MKADFADRFTLKLGAVTVTGRRLTRREVRENLDAFRDGRLDDERAAALVKERVRTADGNPVDPDELSIPQLQALVAEMMLPKEGRRIADFIGALC